MQNVNFLPIRCYSGATFEYLNRDRDKKERLWPLGPLCCKIHGDKGLKYKKDAAYAILGMVLDKSGLTREGLLNELKDLVPQARAAYAGALRGLNDKKVIIMLSADGCLLLLVVFSILGAKPNFPDQHPILGTGHVKENREMWLRSIFFVGNQIPSFWVGKLMESLRYLKDLRQEIGMRGKPLELVERTLFEFAMVSPVPETVDVMQCLRSNFLGPKASNQDKYLMWMVGSEDPHNIVKQPLSASGLCKLGYRSTPLPPMFGYRRIYCKHNMGMVYFSLPRIMVEDDMSLELAMKSVEKWEHVHCDPNTEYQPEGTCFFNLLHHLIRTEADVNALISQGVVGGGKSECLPAILSHFSKMPEYDSQRCQKMEIQKYRPQLLVVWKLQWWILSILSPANALMILILAFLQTGYTIAGHYNPRQR